MTRSAGLFVSFLVLAAAIAVAEADPAYTALRAAAPQGSAIAVQNLTLERDVFRFRFEKGSFQMLAPVEGRVTGAIFIGEGSWDLRPFGEIERRHLALLTGDKGLEVLTDRFDSLVFLFTDDTEAEIRRGGTDGGAASPRAAQIWDAFRRTERKDLKTNLQIRILADLLSKASPMSGVFLAGLPGKKVPAAIVAVDPRGLDWFAPGAMPGADDSALFVIPEFDSGFWYLARQRAEAGAPAPRPAAVAEHYAIESTILDNTKLQGVTTIRLRTSAGDLRVVSLRLFDKLRIQEAAIAPPEEEIWTPIPFIQEKFDEDSDAAVVLPSAPPAGATVRLRLRYEGKDVLHDTGDGSFAVGARQSWYPNLGSFRDLSTFDLTYRVPKGKQVVSVGARVSDRAEGDSQVSVWKAARPIRVAGFNYGKFRTVDSDDKDSGMKIEVYTNPGTPDIVTEINLWLQARGGARSGPGTDGGAPRVDGAIYWGTQAGLQSLRLDTETFAQGALADGVNSARVCTAYFGPLAEKHVAITQQAQWFFGQSWPSLVFLPYLAVLDSTQRRELGMGGGHTTDFVALVGPHELAHQWWGHSVGWASYHDTWLSEGFAEFSASLVMQRTLGQKRDGEYWERARKWILDKPPGSSVANDEAGPISLGPRLATRLSPSAYQALVYSKGAYVVHMLRMLMWDAKARPPDANFIAMMKDFVASFADKSPSTRDFQAVVERHMTPAMDQAHDGKMNWFFRQWIDGTEIPRYTAKVEIQSAGGDQYKLSGSVSQEGVSPDFRSVLPLYLEFDKGEVLRLALVSLVGNQSTPIDTTLKLAKKPNRVVANVFHDTLARD